MTFAPSPVLRPASGRASPLLSLLLALGACAGGAKDPGGDDGVAGDGAGDGADGAGDGADGADGGEPRVVRAQAQASVTVLLPDGSTTLMTGARFALAAAETPADGEFPCEDTDRDGLVGCSAEVDASASSLVVCWLSPEGVYGCAEPAPFTAPASGGASSREARGAERVVPVEVRAELVAPETTLWGRVTLADGYATLSCKDLPELCTPNEAQVTVRGEGGVEGLPVPVGARGDFVLGLKGDPRTEGATLAVEIGDSGPLTAYPAPEGGQQLLMLNEPALQIFASVLKVDGGVVQIQLKAQTRALGREGLVTEEPGLEELRVVAEPNWRGTASVTAEGVEWRADPDAESQSIRICAQRGYATDCAPSLRLVKDRDGTLRLAADTPTRSYAAVGPEGEPVAGAQIASPGSSKDLFIGGSRGDELGEAALDRLEGPRSVWAWAPGYTTGMVYDEGGDVGLKDPVTPIRLVPTYGDDELEITTVRGVTTATTTDGRLSISLPADSLMDDGGIIRREFRVRLAVVDPGEHLPTTLDIDERELGVLTPQLSVYVGFEEVDGRAIDARFNPEVAAPTLIATFADGTRLGEKLPTYTMEPGPASLYTRGLASADPTADGLQITPLGNPGWLIVAQPWTPGHCVSVYFDEDAGYNTVWYTWDDPFSTAAGAGARRLNSNPTVLYHLPNVADVVLTLGDQYGPDSANPEVQASARARLPGRRTTLYSEPTRFWEDCPAVVLPRTPVVPDDDHFFTFRRLVDQQLPGGGVVTADQITQAYYETIDPDDEATTLADWKTNACGWTGPDDAHATYQNLGDLGFVRDMYSHTDPVSGDVCMYVTNYASFNEWQAGTPIATVAMEHSAAPGVTDPVAPKYTKFYVFSADGNSRLLRANLDDNGERSVPHLCMNCHGKDQVDDLDVAINGWPYGGDVGARFLPFDPASYGFLHSLAPGVPSGLTRADQEAELRALNEGVLQANDDPETRSLIHLWYGSTAVSSDTLPATVANSHAIPAGWSGSATDQVAWVEVVQPRCLLCHMSLNDGLDWDNANELANWGNYVHHLVSESRLMPHARRPFQNLYSSRSPHETPILEDFFYARGGWNDPSGGLLECSF